MKVRYLLDKPSDWTREASAREATGKHCPPSSPKAVCWCLTGAMEKCYGGNLVSYTRVIWIVADALALPREQTALQNWNDSPERKFEDVQKLLDEVDI